jgi:hypothetical protein
VIVELWACVRRPAGNSSAAKRAVRMRRKTRVFMRRLQEILISSEFIMRIMLRV